MTQNKRIVINTIATYGRSMFGVLCGVFSARWVLEALGQVDFGLYAVVGGMAIFLSFFNIQFAGAISRYYAYAIGQAKRTGDDRIGLMECRAWFTSAILIHTIVPLILVVVGWPLGIYAMQNNWINIPIERLDACLWVWRIVCTTSFFSMASVPFHAMFTAKQYIAELTIYSFIQTLFRTAFIYYMVINPREWLVTYAFAMGLILIVPQLAIGVRAWLVFKECRIIPHCFKDFTRVKQISNYALWTAVGGIGYVASHQCMSVLLNNVFGARIAGSFGVSQTVSGEAASLTGALQGAFQPAITTAYGAGEDSTMRMMSFRVCKIGTLLTLLFAMPMALEIEEVLALWLKSPPPYAAGMCIATLSFITIEKLSSGHLTAVNASGNVALFQAVRGVLRTLVIPLALIAVLFRLGATIATFALPASAVIVVIGDVWLAQKLIGMSAKYWLKEVMMPIIYLCVVSIFCGMIPRFLFNQSFIRVLVTTGFCLIAILFLSWLIVLTDAEKRFLLQRFNYYRQNHKTR